jgi:hypothetical protein
MPLHFNVALFLKTKVVLFYRLWAFETDVVVSAVKRLDAIPPSGIIFMPGEIKTRPARKFITDFRL